MTAGVSVREQAPIETMVEQYPTCAGCRWWDPDPSSISGRCHRLPPSGGHWRPGREHEMNWIGANWPETMNDDWCGEHRPELVDLTK